MATFKAVLATLAILFVGTFLAGIILGASNLSRDSNLVLVAFALVGAIAVPLALKLVRAASVSSTTACTMAVVSLFFLLSLLPPAGPDDTDGAWTLILATPSMVLGLALGWVAIKLKQPIAQAKTEVIEE